MKLATGATSAQPPPSLGVGQFGSNLSAGVASLVVNMLSGVFMAPFLISRIGLTGYGLNALVLTIVSYLYVVNIVLNAALGRNIAVAIGKGDLDRATSIFSTAVITSGAIGALLIALAVPAAILVPAVVRVAPELQLDAMLLTFASIAVAVLTLWSSPYSVAMFYVNRLDARAWIAVLNRTIYVVLVFVLVELVLPRPAILGVALVASALASWFLTVRSSRRFLPWLRFAWVFDRTALRDLLWFGGWSLVSHGGGLLLLTADLLVVNAFLGTKAGGVYAAMREAPTMIRAFAASSLSVLTQPMAYTFATEGAVELFAYAQRSVRLMGLFLIPPVVVISGLAPDLLRLWLGKTFVPHAPLLIVMSLHLAICLAYTPLTSALLTVLHVRPIGMMTLACGLLNVVIAMVAVRTPLGMYGVAAASVLCWTILNVLVLPFLAARQFGQPVLRVLGPLRMLILLQGLGSGLGLLLSYAWPVGSWAGLVVRAVVVGVVALLASFLLLLMPAERHMALDTISRSVRLLARFNRS